MDKKKMAAIGYAILAAVFYSISMPFSKILLQKIDPTLMASFLYLGAGIGIGAIFLLGIFTKKDQGERLAKTDSPYVIGMILLDIAAPIFLMIGLKSAASANASLLNNFEIVATSIIALFIFKELISIRLWIAILLITASSILLSFENMTSLHFSYGSVFILAATVCWGFENNCTRNISSKNTYEIVMIKGIFSGLGSFMIARIMNETFPPLRYIVYAMILGFVAYGLSIFLYVKAQKELGAAKTSAFYAIAPFIGVLFSVIIIHEGITRNDIIALVIMIAGSALVVIDTIIMSHSHLHAHIFVHTHNGSTHVHKIEHSHDHKHYLGKKNHSHHHEK